jgi:hypothetical protein
MDDNLRQRLGRLDPMPSSEPTDTPSTPRVRALLEEIMSTPVVQPNVQPNVRTTDQQVAIPAPTPPSKRRLAMLGGVAAAVIAIAIVVAVATSGGTTKKSQLSFALPASGPGQASCIQFSTDQLAQAADAFSGTITTVGDGSVTVTVDHWYKASGTKADVVTLTSDTTAGAVSELGVQFVQGTKYFVSATDGHVNGCGYSGEASADLQAAFETAFPG